MKQVIDFHDLHRRASLGCYEETITSYKQRINWLYLSLNQGCIWLTCVCVSVSGQGALWGTVAPVPVSAPSSVSPFLRHHPLQRVVIQPHAAAWAPVDQAGGGATHGAGVSDGLRRRKGRDQGRTTTWERGRQEIKSSMSQTSTVIWTNTWRWYICRHSRMSSISWLTIFHLDQTVVPCDSKNGVVGDNMQIFLKFLVIIWTFGLVYCASSTIWPILWLSCNLTPEWL